MSKISFTLSILLFIPSLFAQNLNKQRVWKISGEKKSIYLDRGVFHSTREVEEQQLLSVRNSYVESRGYERVVFDFSGKKAPKVYGYISSKEKKVYIDFFKASVHKNIASINNVKYVKKLDFFNIDSQLLSVELSIKAVVNIDIFYLDNPARVVVDIRK